MNAKQVLALSLLAWAGFASAQTVPAEAWVGAPVPTTASMASRSDVMSGYVASAATSARTPQELRVGPADAPTGAVSRAETVADLNLWLRAGLGQTAYREGYDPTRADNRARMAMYQRLRNGPEYAAEVARMERRGRETASTASAAGQPASE
ncbi:hypothetical protein [Variovorax sp. JS1663]|uniref:hypothetical protein n=1 Tax=Variovorax sp. JS1663 TaxID=1851577 RepID=UPI000B6C0556|nr:hypothetical protein [Variovorax sp. JS1663]OUM00326.1 hypothetical protein A8M77_21845 [Variovorax sp. JS1663]